MGLFDKKFCSVCGEKIGLLGNRKLEDGNLCKNCAAQLSPWFSERRHSTVDEIKKQLAYREENRSRVAQFRITRSFGENWKVMLDDSHSWVTVTRAGNLEEENPDILDFNAVTGCRLDIDESRTELMRTGTDGKRISYSPPRYEYHYDFNIIITVNNPYFDEMEFRLNSDTVEIVSEASAPMNRNLGRTLLGNRSLTFDPSYNVEYQQYKHMGDEICGALSCLRSGVQVPQEAGAFTPAATTVPVPTTAPVCAPAPGVPTAPAPAAAPAVSGPWTCSCGAVNKGKFCAECGKPKPAGVPQYKCDKCGWEPEDPAHPPKFCPECGDPFDDGDVK